MNTNAFTPSTESTSTFEVNALNVLVTRPEKKSQVLVSLLAQQHITALSQPLFDYHPLAGESEIKTALLTTDILIFVSVAAVTFANASYALNHTSCQHVFAVGQATKQALEQLGFSNVISPNIENSEGLLALPNLREVNEQRITIFRGDGGREHLAQTLSSRGAKVNYVESYQRVWRTLSKNIAKQWQQQQINCIVVTSNAILMKLTQKLITPEHSTNSEIDYWQHHCTWLVASQRIADNAKDMGISRVINMNGASDKVIINQIKQL